MPKNKLYFLSGSKHSEEAEQLLHRKRISFEKIDASSRYMMAAIHRDLGIDELPTLVYMNTRYVGLKKIRDFVEAL